MATFISTTLTKRTGSGTTVFSPNVIVGGVGILYGPGSYAGFTPQLTLQSSRASNARRTRVRIVVPQVDVSGPLPVLASKPSFEAVLYVPDGTLQTDVNDLVGYMGAACASGLANLNNLLVNGEGVY